MAPPADEVDDDDKKPAFQCLYAVRKVVACAVVLLIIAVSVYAVVMVVRPGDLAVGVVGGSVLLTRSNSGNLGLGFAIELDNQSGRGSIYYTGVTIVLVGSRNTSAAAAPANNTIMRLSLGDIIVDPNLDLEFNRFAELDDNSTINPSYAKMFSSRDNRSRIIYGAELTLHGNLTTNLYALRNRTSSPTTYRCSSVTVGGDSYGNDAGCHISAAAATPTAKLCSSVFLVIISIFLVIITSITSG